MLRLLKKVISFVGAHNVLRALSQGAQGRGGRKVPEVLKRVERAESTDEVIKIIAKSSGENREILRREVPRMVEKVEEMIESQKKIESVIQRAKEREKATF
jgi:hypothetical protein